MSQIMSRAIQAIGRASRPGAPARYLFVGDAEWNELTALCQALNAEWRGGSPNYNPREDEAQRSEFMGARIMRVDAKTFLEAI